MLIHSDLWGPSNISNVTSSKWSISFIDNHTRICWVYLLKKKIWSKKYFKKFNVMINTQFQTKIQNFCINNGTEYFNSIPRPYLREHDIIHQSSCIATLQQNGILERKNCHLLEVVWFLMFTTNVLKYFLGEVILIASYLINRMPTGVLQYQTPIEVLKNCYPNIRLVSSFPPKKKKLL